MKIKALIGILLFSISILTAQEKLEDFVKKGVELHDAEKYAEAIKAFEEAAKIDPKNTLVNYEMANTYIAMKEFKKAIKFADKVIDQKSTNLDEAYMLKGTALDMDGKPKDAIKTYKQGIKTNPKSYLLHFNIGITYIKENLKKEAEESFLEAIHLKPAHVSSHLQLGNIGTTTNSKTKALMGYYFYLLLNPDSKFSRLAYSEIQGILPFQQKQSKPNTFEILLAPPGNSDLSTIDLLISMMPLTDNILKDSANMKIQGAENAKDTATVKQIINKISPKDPHQAFANRNARIFESIGEMIANDKKKDKKSFWWTFYGNFYAELEKKGHTEAFSYYISQPSGDKNVADWLEKNGDKVQKFKDWAGEYAFPN